MQKIAKITLGLICLSLGIALFYFTYAVLNSESINPALIDSIFDKIALSVMIISAGLIYGIIGFVLIFQVKKKRVLPPLLGAGFMFAFGLYYCFIFSSPW